MQFIIEEKNLLHFRRSQCLGKVLLGDVEKLADLFFLFQLLNPVRSKAADIIRRFRNGGICITGNGSRCCLSSSCTCFHGSAALHMTGVRKWFQKSNSGKLLVGCIGQ